MREETERTDQAPQPKEQGTEESAFSAIDAESLLEQVRQRLPHCITDYPELSKKINRRDYVRSFADYKSEFRGIFEDLEMVCYARPEQQSENISMLVDEFLTIVEQSWHDYAAAAKLNYDICFDNGRMALAVFLVPMVRTLDLAIGEEFCSTLLEHWIKRNPQKPFRLGTYDEIVKGFERKFKLCFITTAVCREEGKPDDCDELTAFRAFRDGYLMSCPDGPALVEEYYDIAPALVVCLDLCGGSEAYRALRENYLTPCYEDLQNGRLEQCKQRYIRMVRDLERTYLSGAGEQQRTRGESPFT